MKRDQHLQHFEVTVLQNIYVNQRDFNGTERTLLTKAWCDKNDNTQPLHTAPQVCFKFLHKNQPVTESLVHTWACGN